MSFRWALVDLETTGLHIKHDKIIEIAVMIITELGVESAWHTLINPDIHVSNEITHLTGIGNNILAVAPGFSDIAVQLNDMLKDSVVIAHNVRFDYGFLKNAFKLTGMHFQPKLLCTMKLARTLYPEMGKYSLSRISEYFNFPAQQHRAFNDVELLHLFVKQCMQDFPLATLLNTIKTFTTNASIPSKLSTDISTLSTGPGVYLLYGENRSLPIYIGKSVNLRQRIMSHFQSDHSHAKEFKLSQQVYSIETIETTGELSALLLESKLIKEKMPIYNRRLRRKKRTVGFLINQESDYVSIQLSTQDRAENHPHLLGTFSSIHAAKKMLYKLVMEHQLCPKLCGLEKSVHSCFSYQLHRCLGACINKENSEQYNLRVDTAMSQFKEDIWPYCYPIAIKEKNHRISRTQWLIFDQWRHIATVNCLSQIKTHKNSFSDIETDKDAYFILRGYLNKKNTSHELVVLSDFSVINQY